MTRTIAIFNQKGGVGKTTTAVNLSSYLALLGKRVLLVDFDPQFNATVGSGILNQDKTIYHSMFLDVPIKDTIRNTFIHNFEVVPSSADLAGAIIELANIENRERHLKNTLNQIKDDYDYILIDMAPSLSLLTINGLMAADEVLIPIQCEPYSLEGLNQLLNTIIMINNNLNHSLKITGALLTMFKENHLLSEKIAKDIKEKFPYYVFKTIIPRSESLAEAPGEKKPVIIYDPKSLGAIGYETLAKEIIDQENQMDNFLQ
jgi:chromosome partitioning protein